MGFLGKVLFILLLLTPVVFYLFINNQLIPDPDYRNFIPEEKWFGPEDDPSSGDAGVKPFRVNVPDNVIKSLKEQLARDIERLTKPIKGVGFSYGVNTDYLKELITYWKDVFDWRQTEAKLNSFSQFTTYIDGLNIHFLHVRPTKEDSKGKKVIPLLLCHGWPGSVLEFMDILPLLTSPRDTADFVFEVVLVSIPGFGFSSAPTQTGFDALHAAKVFRKLMYRLGHEKFYTQAGDWGGIIFSAMATLYPESVLGHHTNFPQANLLGSTVKAFLASKAPWLFSIPEEELPKLKRMSGFFRNVLVESGYLHVQATKPDTLGVSLTTSPTGLAAWILEKFSTGTCIDNRVKFNGGLTEKFTMDQLFGNVMYYWVTQSSATAVRFYLENLGRQDSNSSAVGRLKIHVPVGVGSFPHEGFGMPKMVLQTRYKDIVTYKVMERGGHFAAMEEPVLLAENVFEFVSAVESRKKQTKDKAEL